MDFEILLQHSTLIKPKVHYSDHIFSKKKKKRSAKPLQVNKPGKKKWIEIKRVGRKKQNFNNVIRVFRFSTHPSTAKEKLNLILNN
jgi:hypothetical protein